MKICWRVRHDRYFPYRPVYKEEVNIRPFLARAEKVFENTGKRYEIVFSPRKIRDDHQNGDRSDAGQSAIVRLKYDTAADDDGETSVRLGTAKIEAEERRREQQEIAAKKDHSSARGKIWGRSRRR